MLEHTYKLIQENVNKEVDRLLDERNPKFNWDLLGSDEHDWMSVLHDVDCDEEWDIWMHECEKYIQERLPGYSSLIKDLRKKCYSVSKSGQVSPRY